PRPAAASYVILALRIRAKVPLRLLLSGRRVQGEGHARAGIGSHVPEDHRLDVRSGPEVMRDLVEVSVVYGPLPVPRPEDGGDRLLQLLLRTLWKLLGHPVRVQSLEIPDDSDQLFGRQVGIFLCAGPAFVVLPARLKCSSVAVLHDP